jgi:hypothetical protein
MAQHIIDRRWIRALAAVTLGAGLTTHALASPLSAHPIAVAVRHGDCEAAIDQINHLAASNDQQAEFLAGRMLDEGICVKQDIEGATHFFARAADLGDHSSLLEYAEKVGLGEGTEQSYEQAGQTCRSAGLDPQARMSAYALGYACTVRGVAGRLLRERLPAHAFQPDSGELLVDFNPAKAQMSIRAIPRVERDDPPLGSTLRRPRVDARRAIEEAWQNAVSTVPTPDSAQLVNQAIQLSLDVDMTLEDARRTSDRASGPMLPKEVMPDLMRRRM